MAHGSELCYNPGFCEWLNKDGNRELVDQVLAHIRSEGGQRGDFEYDGPQRGAWYDWKPRRWRWKCCSLGAI
jgi:uncharacterized protein YcaQ